MKELRPASDRCESCPYLTNLARLRSDLAEKMDDTRELMNEEWEHTLVNAHFTERNIFVMPDDPIITEETLDFKASLADQLHTMEQQNAYFQAATESLQQGCEGPLSLGAVTKAGQTIVATVCQSPNTIADPNKIELVHVERVFPGDPSF